MVATNNGALAEYIRRGRDLALMHVKFEKSVGECVFFHVVGWLVGILCLPTIV